MRDANGNHSFCSTVADIIYQDFKYEKRIKELRRNSNYMKEYKSESCRGTAMHQITPCSTFHLKFMLGVQTRVLSVPVCNQTEG